MNTNKPCSSECCCESQDIHDKAEEEQMIEFKQEYDNNNKKAEYMNLSDICDIEVDGIDTTDYPDFVDAYISKAYWNNGIELTDKELEELNNNTDFVYSKVLDYLY